MGDAWEAEAHAVRVLSALYREIVRVAWPSVMPQFRDAIPRVEVTGGSGVVVDVRVDEGGAEFVFRPSFGRHSTGDVEGAAVALIALVRDCGEKVSIPGGPGGGSGE
ncbi:MAG TPA: hypothetical protein VHJ17_19410 [Thermomonospora sp.]|nr:hypothetical protein [Thermomonospora sp.]